MMLNLNFFALFYDIIAYLLAARYIIDEVLYKLGFKRHLDFKKDLPTDLTGHVAIVTGGTRGLGLTAVRVLVSKGCFVFVASSQREDKFVQIVEKIYDGVPAVDDQTNIKRGSVALHHLDLSSMDSVRFFIQAFKSRHLNLNYLICNAGIMFAPRQLTVDNFESHLAVNYLGHCLLITEMIPTLKETADKMRTNSRIISVASSTHHITRFRFEDILGESNYSSSQAYAQSKLAQIMFNSYLSKVLREKLGWTNLQCFSLHPGVVLSELYEHVQLIKNLPCLIPLIKMVTRDIVQGAETTLYAALSSEIEDKSGIYLEDCSIREPSKVSQDEEMQERLWDMTRGLLFPWLSETSVFFRESKKVQ